MLRDWKKIGVSPEHFPCAVLFDTPSPERALIFPIEKPYIDYFRTLFVELNKTIEAGINSNTNANLSSAQKQNIFEEVRRSYLKLKEMILAKAKPINTNQFIFNGKTVFINQSEGNVSLNNFQND